MFKRRRISDLLEQLDRIPVPDAAARSRSSATSSPRSPRSGRPTTSAAARPTVRDEIRMALDYYESSLFDTLPVLYAEVAARSRRRVSRRHRSRLSSPISAPPRHRFGSWIGGDRDGNPFVTPEATREALAMAHSLLLTHYRRRLQNIFEQLASSTQQVPVSPSSPRCSTATSRSFAPPARLLLDRALPPRVHPSAHRLHHDAPRAPLRNPAVPLPPDPRSLRTPAPPICSPTSPLCATRSSRTRGHRLAELLIDPLLLEVRTYGLHLQTLDIRQHARVHAAAIAEISRMAASATPACTLPPASDPADRPKSSTPSAPSPNSSRPTPPNPSASTSSAAPPAPKMSSTSSGSRASAASASKPESARRISRSRPATRPPLRVHRRPAERPRHHARALDQRGLPAAAQILGPPPGGHARLLRLQQRRRHDHQHLGDLEGAPRAARGRARMRRQPAPLPRPRRHRRPRRRPHPSRHLRAADRQLHRRAPHHRTGRSPQLEVLRRRPRRAQSRADDRRRRSTHSPAPTPSCSPHQQPAPATTTPSPTSPARSSPHGKLRSTSSPPPPTPSTSKHIVDNPDTFTYFEQATPVAELEHARIGSRPAKRGGKTQLAWPTSAPSPGSSAGCNRASSSPPTSASATRSSAFVEQHTRRPRPSSRPWPRLPTLPRHHPQRRDGARQGRLRHRPPLRLARRRRSPSRPRLHRPRSRVQPHPPHDPRRHAAEDAARDATPSSTTPSACATPTSTP